MIVTSKKTKKSKAFRAGLAMRRKVLGPDYVENSISKAGEFGMPFQEMSTEFAWGSVFIKAILPEIEALEKAARKKRS